MARIISFAYTTPALLAGAKTVTRRDWKWNYGSKLHSGDFITAYDKSQRVPGAKPVARLRLTAEPRREEPNAAPDSDYEAEGFAWLEAHPECLPKDGRVAYMESVSRDSFDRWRAAGWGTASMLWVVRFELLEVL